MIESEVFIVTEDDRVVYDVEGSAEVKEKENVGEPKSWASRRPLVNLSKVVFELWCNTPNTPYA